MESIENIKSVYQRIEDEARCELNKVQQQIYRISTLRLLLFVAGIAGIIYFRTESWSVLTGHCTCHPAAVHSPDKIPQPPVSPQRLSGKEGRGQPAGTGCAGL